MRLSATSGVTVDGLNTTYGSGDELKYCRLGPAAVAWLLNRVDFPSLNDPLANMQSQKPTEHEHFHRNLRSRR